MDLELSEVFVCPDCRPTRGLVVLVEEMDERRVLAGSLGCPECDLRVPVRDGAVRFDERSGSGAADATEAADGGGVAEGAGAPGDGTAADTSLRDRLGEDPGTVAAALLGVEDLEGPCLLGPGLGGLASGLAELAGDREVVVLEATAGKGETGDTGVTVVRGVDPGDLPLLPRKVGGVVLLAPDAAAVGEGARVLRPGGRLVVLVPRDEPALHLPDGELEVLASDARAWVGGRPS